MPWGRLHRQRSSLVAEKTVAQAFLTAVNDMPEPQRAEVAKAALALIRDRLKDACEKRSLPRRGKRPKAQKRQLSKQDQWNSEVDCEKTTSLVKAKKASTKADLKREKAQRIEASEPVSVSSDATALPNNGVAR